MRLALIITTALLLTGCAWVAEGHRELGGTGTGLWGSYRMVQPETAAASLPPLAPERPRK